MTYTERLWPNPWLYLVAFIEVPLITLLIAPFSLSAGLVVSVLIFGFLVALLVATSPRITITDSELRVGKAHIDRAYVGRVEVFRGAKAVAARGQKLDARAWTAFRAYVSPVVRVEINDDADPTPYWLFSSRRPEAVAQALSKSAQTRSR